MTRKKEQPFIPPPTTSKPAERETSPESSFLISLATFFKQRGEVVAWGIAAFILMTGIGLLYASKLLNFDPNLGLATGEYQAHVGFISLFRQWLQGQIPFPLWNPVMGYGRSLIADPFLFIFNPFLSVPMFLYGLVNGTKLALVMNFIIAGTGMFVLARGMGLGRLASLWCGLLYMMSGALPSHLIIGQIQLTFSLGWAPWAAAGLFWLLRSPGWGTACAAGVAQALFFFSGNLYHQVYALFTFVIISIIYIVDWSHFTIRKDLIKYVFLVGVLSVGLIAVQLFPLMAARTSMDNIGGYPEDTSEFSGSQLMEYAFLNYIVAEKDFSRSDILDQIPCPQENYRYIGVAPILLLLFVIPAFSHGDRRGIAAMAASFLFLLAWAALEYTFVRDLYEFFPILYQFRDPGRALSVGTIYLIGLSGFALDYVWMGIQHPGGEGQSDANWYERRAFRIGLSLLLVTGLVFSLRRVYGENRELIYLEHLYRPEIDLAVDWLVEHEDDQLTLQVTHTVASKIILDAYELGLRSSDFIDGWRPSAPDYSIGSFSSVQLQPRYRVDWAYDGPPSPEYEVVRRFGELQIWEAQDTFPYAFVVPLERLVEGQPVLPDDVAEAAVVHRVNPNRIVVDLEVQERGMLVVTESWFNGWTVYVDLDEAELAPVGSYLATELEPGVHHVVFEYAPASFTAGWLVSVGTLLVMLGGGVWGWRKRREVSAPESDQKTA